MTTATMPTPDAYPTDRFDYDAAQKTFIGEISDTPGGPIHPSESGEFVTMPGVRVRSNKTNRVAVFVVRGAVRDRENEVMYWELTPCQRTHDTMPELHGVTMRLFND